MLEIKNFFPGSGLLLLARKDSLESLILSFHLECCQIHWKYRKKARLQPYLRSDLVVEECYTYSNMVRGWRRRFQKADEHEGKGTLLAFFFWNKARPSFSVWNPLSMINCGFRFPVKFSSEAAPNERFSQILNCALSMEKTNNSKESSTPLPAANSYSWKYCF